MTAVLERAPRLKKPREEGDYLVWDDVPVWKEHVSPDDDKIPFNEDALKRVVQRNNDRIEDTGDFTPIVIRHTPDDEEGETNHDFDPPVVGLAGPYKIGKYGRKRPKTAIFAKFRIHKRYARLAARYPRLSVEYWAKKKDPTNGFFDPICLLGAETPQLDLGQWNLDNEDLKRYQRKGHRGMVCRRYEMTSPAGSNTSPPAMLGDEERHDYSREQGQGTMTPEDISQIVDAFTPVLNAKFEEMESRMMAAVDNKLSDAGLSPDDDTDLSDDAPPGDDPNAAGAPPIDDAMAGAAPPADSSAPPDAGDAAVPAETPADAPPAESDDAGKDDEDKPAGKFQADETDEVKLVRYQRERDEYRTKYQKLVTENRALSDENKALAGELETLRGGNVTHTRYKRLAALRDDDGYILDVDAETTESADLTDDQFEHHVERIRRNYQRVPTGGLPTDKPQKLRVPTSRDDADLRIKYSRLARERYEEAESKGEKPNFNRLLEQARNELMGSAT